MAEQKDWLVGRKTISAYAEQSWGTIMRLKEKHDFPITKIGGSWRTTRSLIDQWNNRVICEDLGYGSEEKEPHHV